ncbi:MAG TPA: hypothetical protein ENN60_01130 [archaeon]|nr:hypothetical protein [archaeon]
MDLKLKDELTRMLIERPGLSISELARQTNTDYSYVHKVVAEMEAEGRLMVEKRKHGRKAVTNCRVSPRYKQAWVAKLRRFVGSQLKDAEIKAAFVLMYVVLLGVALRPLGFFGAPETLLAMKAPEGDLIASVGEDLFAVARMGSSPVMLDWLILTVVLVVPLLVGVWAFRRRVAEKVLNTE